MLDVEFAMNNHENAFTELISFFAQHNYYFKNEIKSFKKYFKSKIRKIKLIKTNKIIARQKILRFFLKKRLLTFQNDQRQHVNANKQLHLKYKIENLIYVNAKKKFLKKQFKLLNLKNLKFWKIIKNIDNKIYKLKILKHLKKIELISIFHF